MALQGFVLHKQLPATAGLYESLGGLAEAEPHRKVSPSGDPAGNSTVRLGWPVEWPVGASLRPEGRPVTPGILSAGREAEGTREGGIAMIKGSRQRVKV